MAQGRQAQGRQMDIHMLPGDVFKSILLLTTDLGLLHAMACCKICRETGQQAKELRTCNRILAHDTFRSDLEAGNDPPGYISVPESNADRLGYMDGSVRIDHYPGQLPETISGIATQGSLYIVNCSMTSLPVAFGHAIIGGDIHIKRNPMLASLPDSFGSLGVIRGCLLIEHNDALTHLPESFGNIIVHESVAIKDNGLRCLPESLGTMEVISWMILERNQNSCLPNSFRCRDLITPDELIYLNPALRHVILVDNKFADGPYLGDLIELSD